MISANASFLINAVLALGHFAAAFAVLGILLGEDGAWSVPVSFRYNVWNETVDTGKFLISSATISVTEKFYPGYAYLLLLHLGLPPPCSGFDHGAVPGRWPGRVNLYRWLDYAFRPRSWCWRTRCSGWRRPSSLADRGLCHSVLHCHLRWARGREVVGRRRAGDRFLVLFQLLASSVIFVLFWLRYFSYFTTAT